MVDFQVFVPAVGSNLTSLNPSWRENGGHFHVKLELREEKSVGGAEVHVFQKTGSPGHLGWLGRC